MNQHNVPPIVMGWTPLEGLVMAKKHVAPRTHAIRGGLWPLAIWEQSWNNWGNPFVKSYG